MAAPETIEVRFTEDLAQYADLRPVRVQPMTLTELVGLVLTQTGKDRDRVRELLHRGACTYNIYRYWWEAVDPDYTQLEVALDAYPDPDPARVFDPASCRLARFSDLAEPRPHSVEVASEEAARRRLLAKESFWRFLLRFAAARQPSYRGYSYYDKADVFTVEVNQASRAELLEGIRRFAPRGLRRRLGRAGESARVELLCDRPA